MIDSDMAEQIWGVVRGRIPATKRRACARELVRIFTDEFGCDSLYEAEELCADAGHVAYDHNEAM